MNSFLFLNIKIPSFSLPYWNFNDDKKKINIHPSLTHRNQPKLLTVSKEMSDYIKKSTELSLEKQKQRQQITNGKIIFTRQLENVYPEKDDDDNDKKINQYNLTINKELSKLIDSYKKPNHSVNFSPELFYEVGNKVYQNIHYYSCLGLFTGVFIIFLRREKVELSNWFSTPLRIL